MLDFNKLKTTNLTLQPYPHAVIKDIIQPQQQNTLLCDFPKITHPGSIPVSDASYGDGFAKLLDDLHSENFRDILQQLFETNLSNAPILTTVRGVMRNKDGRIHTDSKNKLLTILLYFNHNWQDDKGCLRILNNGTDLEDYVTEIPPSFGTMLIFKVTDNCWHGHYPVVGKRLSLQLNYLTGGRAYTHFQSMHKLSSQVKKLFR